MKGTGLAPEAVEHEIAEQVREQVARADATGEFWGRVQVGSQTIEYHAYTLPNGTINIGTYYSPR